MYAPSTLPLGYERLHESGSLLYIPYQSSIDVFDVNRGDLRQRVNIGQTIQAAPFQLMAIDSTGQKTFILTAQGLTMVQLDSAPLSVGHVSPLVASAGTTLTVRGTGFKTGSAVTLNGIAVGATFIDGQTLSVVVPTALSSGPVIVTVANPGGEAYSLRSAFRMQ